jgi:anti-anti-sigma factor
MSPEAFRIDDQPADELGRRVLSLHGPLVVRSVSGFQTLVRSDTSRALIVDLTDVPQADSAGIGALIAASLARQSDGRILALVGVSERIHHALEVTRVEQFFRFFDSVSAARDSAST